jgi:hypothetical protein
VPKVFTVPYYVDREPFYEEAREYYSHCVGKGWHDLLCDLTDKLFYLGWDGGLDQVKEKFGTLRFYWRNNITDPMKSKIAEDLASYTECKSGWTCESCGGFGKTRGDGWVHTMCDKCWDKHLADKAERKAKYEQDALPHPVD